MSDKRKTGAEVSGWRDEAMFSTEPVVGDGPQVYLVNATPDPLGSIAAVNGIYAGIVHRSRSKITDEQKRYEWEQVEKTHLKAPLEFVQVHFLVEGVTRAFTHQMVRQRTAAFAQESMRFGVKENMAAETELPPSIRPGSDQERIWFETLQTVEEAYLSLVANGIPAEDARGLAPHAVRTRIHYVTSLNNFINYSGDRLCTQAQFEWRLVWAGFLRSMMEHTSYPHASEAGKCDNWQWRLIAESNQFRPVCYKLGKCPWKGDIDRPCKIRDRVEEGRWEEIDIREWLLDPNAAR